MTAARATGVAVVVLLLAFLTVPSLVVIVMSFNPTAIMAFPPHGLSLRWYENALTYPQFQRAAVNSLVVPAAGPLPALANARAGRRRWSGTVWRRAPVGRPRCC